CGARPMIGSANADALPVPEIWQASKIAAVRCRLDQLLIAGVPPLSSGREVKGSTAVEAQRPGRSSRLSSPAATLRTTWPCTLSGCSEIEFAEPPTRTLPPAPTPIDALPCAPA